MPPIDSRIPLMGRGVELNDPLDVTAKAITLHSMMQQDQAQGAYAINPQTGEVDVASTRKNLAKISPKLAMQFDRDQNMHQAMMLKASRDNETQQRLGEKARLDAAKERAKMYQGVVKNSLLTYYDALHQGGDENAARQAGDQAYKAGLGQLHEQGAIGPKAMQQQVSFDPDKFQQTMGMSEDQWTQTAAKIGDMDVEGGYSDGPGADAGGGMMPAAMVQGQPAQGAPAAPGLVQTAAAKAPAFTEQDVQALPDISQAAPAPGKGYNWQKAYQYTQLRNPKINPTSSSVIYDYRTGQPIENEPVIRSKERVGKSSRSEINVGNDAIGLGKMAENRAQVDVMDMTAGLARVQNIKESFRPEYLQLPTKAAMLGLDWAEKAGVQLSPENRDRLSAYKTFGTDAYDTMNRYIKEITGAAMSEQEANRLRKSIPDPENDGPTAFKAKLDRMTTVLERATQVYTRLLDKGIPKNEAQQEAKRVILGVATGAAPARTPAPSAPVKLESGQQLNSLPDPATAPNAIIRAPDGTRYQSDGKGWKVLK